MTIQHKASEKIVGQEFFDEISRRSHIGWFHRQRTNHCFHKEIYELVCRRGIKPKDMGELVMNWPHKSEEKPDWVVYTQSHAHGECGRQTHIKLGKYLRRHFPTETFPDHKIRDIVAKYDGTNDEMGFVHDVIDMIKIVQYGPKSCMQGDFWDFHPYNAYSPKFGWHMAYRKIANDPTYWGRALCLTTEDGKKIFVRSYKRCLHGGYSHADERLEAWLKDQGYEHTKGWPKGTKLARIEGDGDRIVAPCLDGDLDTARDTGGHLILEPGEELGLTGTDGYAVEYCEACTDCGERIDLDHDNFIRAGRDEDHIICSFCRSNYDYVQGFYGDSYYLHAECVVTTVEGDAYDERCLDWYDIIKIDCGKYAREYTCEDNTVEDLDGNIRHKEDIGRSIIKADAGEYRGEYIPIEESWKCNKTGYVYHDNDPSLTLSNGYRVYRRALEAA